MNPRYAIFAQTHGRTVEEQLAVDLAKKSGRMVDFITWSRERLAG